MSQRQSYIMTSRLISRSIAKWSLCGFRISPIQTRLIVCITASPCTVTSLAGDVRAASWGPAATSRSAPRWRSRSWQLGPRMPKYSWTGPPPATTLNQLLRLPATEGNLTVAQARPALCPRSSGTRWSVSPCGPAWVTRGRGAALSKTNAWLTDKVIDHDAW